MTARRRTLEVGSRFGPYRLDRLIGRGGMGEVFEAYDTVKDRTIALKVLPERLHDDPVFRERFRRESHVAARLQEPHIIPIHDYGEIDGRLFIDMRLVGGASLRAVLNEQAPLDPQRTIAIVRQVAAARGAPPPPRRGAPGIKKRAGPPPAPTSGSLPGGAAPPPPDRVVLLAETQVQGRGRHARPWVSPPRAQLAMSLLVR
ncbi:protein kinase domain-containing protein, partial [Nocardia asiatica]|uniref:protein kinase domain-containing protein n=1 Tax=Nocardia asiatica TaxID=209252 RepID=UPI002455EE35